MKRQAIVDLVAASAFRGVSACAAKCRGKREPRLVPRASRRRSRIALVLPGPLAVLSACRAMSPRSAISVAFELSRATGQVARAVRGGCFVLTPRGDFNRSCLASGNASLGARGCWLAGATWADRGPPIRSAFVEPLRGQTTGGNWRKPAKVGQNSSRRCSRDGPTSIKFHAIKGRLAYVLD